jgi:CTP synthase
VREKLSIYSNVPIDRLFSMHDSESIYLIPEMLKVAGLDDEVVRILRLEERVHEELQTASRQAWNDFVARIRSPQREIRIAVMGKYTTVRDSYASIIHALEHAGAARRVNVDIKWVDTTEFNDERAARELANCHGMIVPGGFGVRGVEGKIAAIRHARETSMPYLGLCYGFQLAVIEFARNVCRLEGANSTEIDPDSPHPVVDILPEQKQIEGLGGNMRLGGRDVLVKPGTLASRLFNGSPEVRLRFRHRYEVDPRYIDRLEAGGLVFSGKAPDYPIMQIMELPVSMHPYFIGTQAHPEFQSRPLRPQPFFLGLVEAAIAYADAKIGTAAPTVAPARDHHQLA